MFFFGGLGELWRLAFWSLKVLGAALCLVVHAAVWVAVCFCRVARQVRSASRPLEQAGAFTQRPRSMDPGTFIVVRRGGEWDELMLVHQLNASEWMGYTVTAEVDRFMWTAVRLTLGQFRLMTTRGGDRQAPRGVDESQVNWMIDPDDPNLARRYAPTAPELVNLCIEATAIADETFLCEETDNAEQDEDDMEAIVDASS